MAYQWTANDDEIAIDAIMVCVGGTSARMLMIGLSYVEPSARIYWSARMGPDGNLADAGEEMGPWLVPDALNRAEEIRAEFGFARIVVTMEERGIWRDEWGTLAEKEGFE